jgi:hypothetical protein
VLAIFLGAGFSAVAGVPLAANLFDEEPTVDRITREHLVERVLAGWQVWHSRSLGAPEEYLAHLQSAAGRAWHDAVWFVGLMIALKMGRVDLVGNRPTVTRHNLDRTTGQPVHEQFWSVIFKATGDVAVLTTNYDILPERGLRTKPRHRLPRPGFHYGFGPEALAGGGYPSFSHIRKIQTLGSVPLLKLHGSVSWSFREHQLVRYHDCRPAIRGDAAIVAPVTAKSLPDYLAPTWRLAEEALAQSSKWIFVGYSLPKYDRLVIELLRSSYSSRPQLHVFDIRPEVADHYRSLLGLDATWHPGLPNGLNELASIVT